MKQLYYISATLAIFTYFFYLVPRLAAVRDNTSLHHPSKYEFVYLGINPSIHCVNIFDINSKPVILHT